jgi:tetratricopeptide (TPR) repeat protein
MSIGKIPIGRRILELMNEKGNAFSIRAFADRLGENRETFRQTLLGNRPISLSLVERIAEGLSVSEERLRQLDSFKKEEELVSLLKATTRTKVMLMRAHSIALELAEIAVGSTERGFAFNNLGRAQYLMQQYEDAHESWKKALVFAREMQHSFEDNRLLRIVAENLMLTSARLKDYGGANEMLQLVERTSADDPNTLGMIAYARMVMYGDRGNLESSKRFAYESLEHFRKTNNKKQIGYGHLNVARIEYLSGNYEASVQVLDYVFDLIQDCEDILVGAVKEYVRALVKLGKHEIAVQIAKQHESVIKQFPSDWHKLQVMYTVLKDDPTYAINVAENLHASVEVRILACKCLFEYYLKQGDAETAIRYYELERKYSRDNSEFFDREGF